MIITSSQNPKIKELKKLMKDKSLVFLDSPKLIGESKNSGCEVLYLIKSEHYGGKMDYGGEVIEVSDSIFKQFSLTENSQGLVGVVKLKKNYIEKPKGNFLVLDGLQDPGNVGTLIRSALGADFMDVYLLNSVSLSNDKLLRATMGAIFKVRVYELDKDEFIKKFKTWNLPLLVCDMDGEDIYNINKLNNVGVVVGNEGNGISDEMLQLATKVVSIPMKNGLESLNAGVSGSIIMYEISNKKGEI